MQDGQDSQVNGTGGVSIQNHPAPPQTDPGRAGPEAADQRNPDAATTLPEPATALNGLIATLNERIATASVEWSQLLVSHPSLSGAQLRHSNARQA